MSQSDKLHKTMLCNSYTYPRAKQRRKHEQVSNVGELIIESNRIKAAGSKHGSVYAFKESDFKEKESELTKTIYNSNDRIDTSNSKAESKYKYREQTGNGVNINEGSGTQSSIPEWFEAALSDIEKAKNQSTIKGIKSILNSSNFVLFKRYSRKSRMRVRKRRSMKILITRLLQIKRRILQKLLLNILKILYNLLLSS